VVQVVIQLPWFNGGKPTGKWWFNGGKKWGLTNKMVILMGCTLW